VLRTKAAELDKENRFDEACFLESEGVDLTVDDEARVRKAKTIKTGHHLMIKNHVCRVEKVGTSKIWKGPLRGCFQAQLVARCIFTGKKFEHNIPATEDVCMAAVQRQVCTVVDIGDDGELSLLTPAYDMKNDVNLSTGTDGDRRLSECIKKDFHRGKTVTVVVLSSCGIEKVVSHKSMD
jgi:translation elongation factor P/translation initiation factor 5A